MRNKRQQTNINQKERKFHPMVVGWLIEGRTEQKKSARFRLAVMRWIFSTNTVCRKRKFLTVTKRNVFLGKFLSGILSPFGHQVHSSRFKYVAQKVRNFFTFMKLPGNLWQHDFVYVGFVLSPAHLPNAGCRRSVLILSRFTDLFLIEDFLLTKC